MTQPAGTLARVTLADRSLHGTFFDELLDVDGPPRAAAKPVVDHLAGLGLAELQARQDAADLDILAMGITFTVYADGAGHRPGRGPST